LLKQMPLQQSAGSMQPPPSAVHPSQSMPQMLVASLTQMLSQLPLQQKGSTLQICCWHGPQAGESGAPTSQTVCGQSMPPHTPPAQMPAQHSPEKLHEAPFGRQPPQMLPTHAPLQHSPGAAHFAPWGWHSLQTPLRHDPSQHSPLTLHGNPRGWHGDPEHVPAKQLPEQHCSFALHIAPAGAQLAEQTPSRQIPEQHEKPSKQEPPEGMQPPQTPFSPQKKLQHSPSMLHSMPSGKHSLKPQTKPSRHSPRQHG